MRKFALLGKRLDYSFSKSFFSDFFQKNKIDASFENIEIEAIDLLFHELDVHAYSGLTVTIPYKEAIIPYLDELSPEAEAIGAVNVLRISNGKTKGYNSDAFGFHQSIKPFLTNKHEKALILGTGGASKAVEYVLKSIGVEVLFISRNPVGKNQFSYEEINQHMVNACKIVVNCTPVGTFPDLEACPTFPFEFLSEDHLVVDLIYNPQKTKFLRVAEENGASILNGYSMLQEQALKAWDIWNSTI
jgi:shikimate dehydrogenase